MCAHWKSLARKILKSRELAKLEVQQIPIEVPVEQEPPVQSQSSLMSNPEEFKIVLQKQIDGKFSLVLEGEQLRPTTALKQPIQHQKAKVQYFDNQQYCICRRGDDGFGFMIECDSCKEWFHGDCVGISKQLGNKINQYICIGCARVNFNFDPWNYQQQLQIQQQQKEEQTITENFNLSVFTQIKRSSYEDLRTLIVEGQTEIPIFLEEMGELLDVQIMIEEWISCIQPILEDPPIESEEEISSADKVFTYTQPNQRKSMDKIILDIMKLYLESESFPVEHPNAEDLILIMKQRKWFLDAQKILIQNQSATKNNKAVLRKNAKRLIQQFNELRIAHYPNLCQLQRDLQWLLQAQNQPIQQVPMQGGFMMAPYPQHQQQPHFQQQRNQMIQIQGPKKVKPSTHDRKWLPDDFPQNDSYIQRTLNKLFASGNVQYSECANIIEEVELNNLYESDQDREHIMHLKNLLSEYTRWLNEVRECLNKSKKKNETADEFLALMDEGDQVYPMMRSAEKEQYEIIRKNYQNWVPNCQAILDQISQQEKYAGLYANPERLKFFIVQMEKRYDQIQLELNNHEQVILQDDHPMIPSSVPVEDEFNILQRQIPVDNNNTLSKDNILHNEGSHDFFK